MNKDEMIMIDRNERRMYDWSYEANEYINNKVDKD